MMRITNSMMTANSKSNLNINKTNADKLNTMTSSGQKITRPSDDPVVAIRAMRLNTSLTELEQYGGKNIPDADAWFTDTETALSQTDGILSDIREKLNQASSEENVTSNVKDILEELKQLRNQFYALGNSDSAGRTVFTGYRTGEMLTFMEQDKIEYNIEQHFTKDDLRIENYVAGTASIDKNGVAFDGTDELTTYQEEKISSQKYYRLRLAYDDIDMPENADDRKINLDYTDEAGNPKGSIELNIVELNGKKPSEIDAIYTGGGYVIKETGEVILSKEDYDKLIQAGDISLSYNKTNWEKGDLRPEHYFKCFTPKVEEDPRTYSPTYPDGIEYNYNRVDAEGNPTTKKATDLDPSETNPDANVKGFKEQELTYEIAFNQSIAINIHANDVYSHDIGRDIDELISITQQMANVEAKQSDIEKAIENETDTTKLDQLNANLAAIKKERAYVKEKMHSMYTSAISSFKGYSDDINKQISNVGALTSRLEMTKNRVKDQKNNVKKLADQNINADIAETALDFKNAQLALEAAQLAAGKISNQTLLNYI